MDYAFQLFFFILSPSQHFTHFKGRMKGSGGGGAKQLIESLRVGFFYELRSWLPLLHRICVQIGGEESQDVSVLVIMCMKVCATVCE